MGEIVWLVSYPKSGNTWTRAFLTRYLGERPDEFDINRLDGSPIASARAIFDLAVGVESSCLTAAEIEELRGQAFVHFAREESSLSFLKAHEKWSRAASGAEIFPREITRSVIYLVRNPLDVAVSASHHFSFSLDRSVALLSSPTRTLSRRRFGIVDQLPQHLGTWSEHVQSWLDESGLPCHVMRYEDMLADPGKAFSGLLTHLGLDLDRSRLRQSVEEVAFDRLTRQEEERGFRERPLRSTAPFFRSGRAGVWKDALNSRQVEDIVCTHRRVMLRFGYLSTSGRPI